MQIRCGGLSGLSRRDILLEIENVDYLYINSILLITKYYIYSCKFKKVVPSFLGVMSLLRHKYKIELFSASMLPPAKRQRVRDGMNYYFSWVRIKKQHVLCGNRCFCNFVYYIYCTTLLMYGLVKKNKKLFCMIKLYTYIYFLYRHEHDYVNCQLGNNNE